MTIQKKKKICSSLGPLTFSLIVQSTTCQLPMKQISVTFRRWLVTDITIMPLCISDYILPSKLVL